MAFTGAATIKVLSGHSVRITGLSLGVSAAGTIGLHNATTVGVVKLPASFAPKQYANAEGHQVTLQDAIDVKINKAAADANATQYSIVKAGVDVDGQDFVITITNLVAQIGPALEIYVNFLGG
jgi:hypothetical protein